MTGTIGVPLAAILTRRHRDRQQRNDVTQLLPSLEVIPPVRGKRSRLQCRPDVVLGDRGYDHDTSTDASS
ncbi:hypothetical protein [Actinomadura sp. 9N215]|uniref:hypothetical protein n=1 Tax=Actinomadura sp. 9N215 TaxID=3375150 RepID=UPI0037908B25